MAKINSKRKGKRGELECAALLSDLFGLTVRRGVQYHGGPDSPDLLGLDGVHVEVKWVEKLNIYEAINQSVRDAGENEIPIVVHHRNRDLTLVTCRLVDLIPLGERIVDLSKKGKKEG